MPHKDCPIMINCFYQWRQKSAFWKDYDLEEYLNIFTNRYCYKAYNKLKDSKLLAHSKT